MEPTSYPQPTQTGTEAHVLRELETQVTLLYLVFTFNFSSLLLAAQLNSFPKLLPLPYICFTLAAVWNPLHFSSFNMGFSTPRLCCLICL